MRRARTICGAWLAVLLALLGGCATTDPEAIRYAGFRPESDEAALWASSEEIDAALRERGVLYEDPALQEYLDGVMAGLAPSLAGATRIRVLRDPYLNAFALPNGSIYLHSGMLASLENEAHLATVLGHELTHYTERHSLARQRTAANRALAVKVVFGVLAVAVAASGDANAVRAMLDLGKRVAPSLIETQVNGFSRELEHEADAGGFALMVAAGHDPREAPRVFEILHAEASDAGVEEPFFFGSHPALIERLDSYRALAAARGHPGAGAAAPPTAFDAAVGGVRMENAKMDIAMGRPDRARRAIERHLAYQPAHAPAVFLLGEAHRRARNVAAARSAYERAAALDARYAAPHRELGLLCRAAGDQEGARRAFARYLALASSAADRPIIEAYMTDPEEVP